MGYGDSRLRQTASGFLKRYCWLPAIATLASGLALLAALIAHAGPGLAAGAAAALLCTSYLWGYSSRAARQSRWPALGHLPRRQYADVWDSLAASASEAMAATARGSSDQDVRNLMELVSISPQDDVLEIGPGVGRLGLEIAPHCRRWTGADISSKVLGHAADQLRGVKNAHLIHLPGIGLGVVPDSSLDVVYCINVFAHLDEIDRWRYVQDAYRVLRHGGRIYIENVDLESEAGWIMFTNHARHWETSERPPYDTRFSTAAELMAYASRAGFERIQAHHRPPQVIVTAVKL